MHINKNPIWINKNISNKTEREEVVNVIKDLSSSLNDFANMEQAIKILTDFRTSVKNVDFDTRSGLYRYLNYHIIPGLKAEETDFIRNLLFINKLGHCRTSAPELIHHATSKDNRFDVIIYKLNDTQGGKLIPLTSLKDITPEKKEKFITEQLNLLEDTGIYNRAVIDSYDYWFLTPDTHNIFIDSWGNMGKCFSAQAKDNVKEILKNRV